MTRVLHLTRDFPPRSCGGLSTAVGSMVAALQNAGIKCAVVSFDNWRPQKGAARQARILQEEDQLYPLLRIDSSEQLEVARTFAAAFEPTLMHIHDSLLWQATGELRQYLGLPTIYTVHVLHSELARQRGGSPRSLACGAEAQALAQTDAICAPSRCVARLLARDYPSIAPRVHLAPLGVCDTAEARAAVAARIPRDPRQAPRLLFVGRYSDINGTDELFDALPALHSRWPNLRLELAGGLPHSPKAERRWQKRFARDVPPKLRELVRLLGWLDPVKLAAARQRADILVAPSRFETFGLVVAEAMLFGLPIVACSAGALPELITDGETGVLCASSDAGALSTAVQRLGDDSESAHTMGQRAARWVREHRTWQQTLATLVSCYEQLS